MIRSTLFTFTKHTMGRVRRLTSTKQRSMTLVVRSFRHKCRGKLKNDSSSGIALQWSHQARVIDLPAAAKAAKGSLGLASAVGPIDCLRVALDLVVIASPHVFQKVPHLVHPAALMQHPGIHRRNR